MPLKTNIAEMSVLHRINQNCTIRRFRTKNQL